MSRAFAETAFAVNPPSHGNALACDGKSNLVSVSAEMQSESAVDFVLYDADCPLCTFQMKLLTWLDWFGGVRLVPISDPRANNLAPNLRREELLESIHCVARNGHIYRGARCIRFLGLRMPLLIPIALVLWIPGILWIAERVYMWVSRNRHLLSRIFGCKQACAILPARKRQGEGQESRAAELTGAE